MKAMSAVVAPSTDLRRILLFASEARVNGSQAPPAKVWLHLLQDQMPRDLRVTLRYWQTGHVYLAFFLANADPAFRRTETPYRAPNRAVAPVFCVRFANQFPSWFATSSRSSVHRRCATSNISANSAGVNTPLNPFCREWRWPSSPRVMWMRSSPPNSSSSDGS